MSREIKFRARRIDSENWVYGFVIEKYGKCYISHEVSMKSSVGRKKVWVETEVVKDTVCQYTGLKGRNGKEIYESDFYETAGGIYQIFFKNGAFCGGKNIENCAPLGWDCEENGYDEYNGEMCEGDFFNEIEVIGNIYENADLLIKN